MKPKTFKILIPYDFSECANHAMSFTADNFSKNNLEVSLLHVYRYPILATDIPIDNPFDESYEKEIYTNLKNISEGFSNKYSIKIFFETQYGFEEEEIINKIRDSKFNLVVMGTKGATGLKKVLFGSITSKLIMKSNIPVLVLPEKSSIKKVRHIVLPSTLTDLDNELNHLISLAQLFNAEIHVIHFYPTFPNKISSIIENAINFEIELQQKFDYKKISFYAEMQDNIMSGLMNYIKNHKVDLLAMHTFKRNFFEQYMNPSKTKELIYTPELPVLVYNINSNDTSSN